MLLVMENGAEENEVETVPVAEKPAAAAADVPQLKRKAQADAEVALLKRKPEADAEAVEALPKRARAT